MKIELESFLKKKIKIYFFRDSEILWHGLSSGRIYGSQNFGEIYVMKAWWAPIEVCNFLHANGPVDFFI